MKKTRQRTKKSIKSRRLPNTKRSSASTLTSKAFLEEVLPDRKARAKTLAGELFSSSLISKSSNELQEAIVEGVSMWPTLRHGYRISYRAVPADSLTTGDLLVLRGQGRRGERHLRVHRLIGRVGAYFVEAGDNTYSAALVLPDDILGRVEAVRDWKGQLVKFQNVKHTEQMGRRARYFLLCAHGFMFAHECKNRILGNRRSLLLWRLSQVYRASIATLGLKVPSIQPE
jgi:hypothetical protein